MRESGQRWLRRRRRPRSTGGSARAFLGLALLLLSAAAGASPQRIVDAGLVVVVRTAGGGVANGVVVGPNEVATSCSVLAGAVSITVHEAWKQPVARPAPGVAAAVAARDEQGRACLLFLEEPFWRSPPVAFAPVVPSGSTVSGYRPHQQIFTVSVAEGDVLTVRRGLLGTPSNPVDGKAVSTLASRPDPRPEANRSALPLSRAGTAVFDEHGRLVAMIALERPRDDGNDEDQGEAPERPVSVPARDIAKLLEFSAEWRGCLVSPTPACVLAEVERAAIGNVWAVGRVAAVARDLGAHEGARAFLRESLDVMLARGRVAPNELHHAALDLIEAGDEAAALRALELSKAAADQEWSDDVFRRLDFFERLAASMVKAGTAEAAADQAAEALVLVNDGRGGDRALRAAVMVQFSAGQVAAALSTVRMIGDPDVRDFALSSLSRSLVDAGDLDAALWSADEIAEPGYRAAVRAGVVEALASRGEAGRAIRVAGESTDPEARLHLLSPVVTALVEAGDFEAALQVAQQSDDSWGRVSLLRSVAASQAKAGELGAALTTTELLRHAHARAPDYYIGLNSCETKAYCAAVVSVAGVMARAGDVAAARAIVGRLESPHDRLLALAGVAALEEARGDSGVRAALSKLAESVRLDDARDLEDVAVARAAAGDRAGAERTLQWIAAAPWGPRGIAAEIDDPALSALKTDGALARIARAEAAAGNLGGALQTASRVGHGFRRLSLLRTVAEGLAAAGDPGGAQATFAEAVDLFERLNDAKMRPCCAGTHPLVWTLEAMMHSQATAGLGEEALETLGRLELREGRGFSLHRIVHAASSRGEFGLALRAQSVMSSHSRVEALGYIARGLAGLPPGDLPQRID